LIIFILVGGSIYAVVAYPYNKLGGLWYSQLLTGKSYTPKLAQPIWVNWFRRDHLPSTIILDSRNGTAKKSIQAFKPGGTGNIIIDY